MTGSWGQFDEMCAQQSQLYAAAQDALDEGDHEYVQACIEAVVALAPTIDALERAVWEEWFAPFYVEAWY